MTAFDAVSDALACPVLVIGFPEQGEASDMVLGGEYPTIHTVTIADVSAGCDLPPGTEFDWFCSCELISEGNWSGCWPGVAEAELNAIRVHFSERTPLIISAPYMTRFDPREPVEEPF